MEASEMAQDDGETAPRRNTSRAGGDRDEDPEFSSGAPRIRDEYVMGTAHVLGGEAQTGRAEVIGFTKLV